MVLRRGLFTGTRIRTKTHAIVQSAHNRPFLPNTRILQHGKTPLHEAAGFGNKETVALLLDRGAAMEAKDKVCTAPHCVRATLAG